MLEQLAYTIEDAIRLSGVGRVMLYEAIGEGRLEARKAGRRTLILRESLQQFLENLPRAQINMGKKQAGTEV